MDSSRRELFYLLPTRLDQLLAFEHRSKKQLSACCFSAWLPHHYFTDLGRNPPSTSVVCPCSSPTQTHPLRDFGQICRSPAALAPGVTLPWCFRLEATRPNDKLQRTWDKRLGGPVSDACVLKIRGMRVLGEINAAVIFRWKKWRWCGRCHSRDFQENVVSDYNYCFMFVLSSSSRGWYLDMLFCIGACITTRTSNSSQISFFTITLYKLQNPRAMRLTQAQTSPLNQHFQYRVHSHRFSTP
jgi:hypothetical protein